MRFLVLNDDTLRVEFEAGESIKAESDAVVSLSHNMTVQGRLEGGILSGLARVFLTGESLFFQRVEATHGAGEALLAPVVPGSIITEDLATTGALMFQKGAFLAAGNGVEVATATQSGLSRGLLSGTGIFVLNATGNGPVAFGAYGSVHKYLLRAGETRAVDNGHVVAWSQDMQYRVGMANSSSIATSITSGEGLMCFFTGPGVVYVQSRNPDAFRAWASSGGGGGGGGGGGNGIGFHGSAGAGVTRALGVCGSLFMLLLVIVIFVFALIYGDFETGVAGEHYQRRF